MDHLQRGFVALFGGVKSGAPVDAAHVAAAHLAHQAGGAGGHHLDGLADEGRHRSIGFQAALATTGALHAVVDQDGVARLTAVAVAAQINFPVHHEAAAHAGAEGQHQHVVIALRGARDGLCQGGAIRVVGDVHRNVPVLFELAHKVGLLPAEVVGEHDALGSGLDGAGRADARILDVLLRQAGLCHHRAGGGSDVAHHRLEGTGAPGGHAVAGHELIVLIDDAGGDVGAAKVDAEVMLHKCSCLSLRCFLYVFAFPKGALRPLHPFLGRFLPFPGGKNAPLEPFIRRP